jgi:hypothetical protein
MMRMTFECPETGKPINRMSSEWLAGQPDAVFTMHCPKCSGLHSFSRSDAMLEVDGAFAPTAAPVGA